MKSGLKMGDHVGEIVVPRLKAFKLFVLNKFKTIFELTDLLILFFDPHRKVLLQSGSGKTPHIKKFLPKNGKFLSTKMEALFSIGEEDELVTNPESPQTKR